MNSLDRKIVDSFPGKAVRKDLTSLMKKGYNVPTYVLEYLLGMYCASDDEDTINVGVQKIKQILSENYVRPDQSEFVKSRIKENGEYTIIDKLSVVYDETEDQYIAYFTNLQIDPFIVSSDLVIHNDKLLTGGIWCMIKICYVNGSNDEEEEMFEDKTNSEEIKVKKKKKAKYKSKYRSSFGILNLKPIQMPNLDLKDFLSVRSLFSKDEWVSLLIRSAGYEPAELSDREKKHYLLRFVPMIQKNYNLVELGPRGTGKSHIYSEISPYSILMSSGTTTVSNMFYNMQSRRIGLVGNWDCIAFDEVAGISHGTDDMRQMMKNYMANGSFARGTNTINSDASIVLEGNTAKSVYDMLRTTDLFEPFPAEYHGDSAFFDRIHAYLPGWETPKLRNSLFTSNYGLISDCFSEFCHVMRKYDFTNSFSLYFELNSNFNTRDEAAVRRTFSGLVKLIYPNEQMSKEEVRELLEYSIECRRRVKEQLCKMNPIEYNDINLGYIDLDTQEETIVYLPETSNGTLVSNESEPSGYAYGVGKSINGDVAIYRLENKLIPGNGSLNFKNVEGISKARKSVKDSITAAFNCFKENCSKNGYEEYQVYDYSIFFNDLQSKGVSDEVSLAETIGLFSAILGKPVLNSLVICGRVVMSGGMLSITSDLEDIFVAVINAGALRILLPEECREKYNKLRPGLKASLEAIFYNSPIDAINKALKSNY